MIGALEAARLVEADYADPEGMPALERLEAPGYAFAILLHRGVRIGLCRGTTDRAGWRCNLRFLAGAWPESGDSGARYHGGWLEQARIAHAFFKGKSLSLIVGHSKGAAVGGIVGASAGIRVPVIGLAAPQAQVGELPPPFSGLVVNHCRTDDAIAGLPPGWLGYRHIGRVVRYRPAKPHRGEDHRIRHLIRVLDGSEPCEVEEG